MSIREIDLLNKQILDSLPFGYALINDDLSFLSFNDIFAKLFSFESSPNPLISPFFNVEIKNRLREAFETGNEIVSYWTSEHSKRKFKSLLINIIPLLKEGKVQNLLCLVNDNSEPNQWQKEFNLLFEKVPAFISIVDKEFNVVRSNERYRDTFGENHSVFTTEQSRKKAFEHSNSPTALSFKEGREQVSTQIGMTKAGNKIHLVVTSTPLALNENGVSLVMEIATDITELNQLQDQLHQAHDFYSDLIESSADGIIAIDNKGKTQIFNQSARKILNWDNSRKPGIGKINEILPDEFFGEADAEGNLIVDKEILFNSYSGETFPVRISAFELRNKKNAIGKVAFIQDLRRIKELENEKRKAEEEALSTTFLALENNIQKVQNDQQFLLDQFENVLNSQKPEEIEKSWNVMRKKMNYIFDVVSTFMKSVKGFEPNYQNISIKSLANNVIEYLKTISENSKIDLNLFFIGDFDMITVDLDSLEIILKILVANGMDSVAPNLINPKVMLVIELNEVSNNLIIEVTDNGAFLEPDTIEKYFRLKDSVDTRMGLLTIDMIVKNLGGSFLATSQINEGNKFKIILPVIRN